MNAQLYHKSITREIKKFLPEKLQQDEAVQRMLRALSVTFAGYERDKQLSDHAFTISEREYQEVNAQLKKQNEIDHQLIGKIWEGIRTLDPNSDISQKQSELDILQVAGYLERQILKTKQLEKDLLHAKNEAEKASRAKSDFLSVMSHEIRTPLNAIIGVTHLLRNEPHLPAQEENFDALHISAENLFTLINDILDFNKIEEGKIVFSEKPFDLRKLLSKIKTGNQARAESRGNCICVEADERVPDCIIGDEVRLGQVLNNLVSNAVKFTENGKIAMEVTLSSIHGDRCDLLFRVSDTGIGIDEEKQKLVFERFTQANSEITRDFGGSGLGLAIVKQLLALQRSTIQLQSSPGEGSVFSFRLSMRVGRAEELERSFDQQLNGNQLRDVRILLAEDYPFNVLVAQKMLSSWGAEVDVAGNGQVAVDKVKDRRYDVILMDLQMPVMDGYSATRIIRSFNPNIPIIALTASATIEIQDKSKEMGMTDFLSKPFNPKELLFTILKYTGNGN